MLERKQYLEWLGAGRGARLPRGSAIEGLRVSQIAAFGTIEFRDRVGAEFVNTVGYAIFLILARSEGALNQNMSSLGESFGVFGELSEGDNPMPIGSALPFAGCIFP